MMDTGLHSKGKPRDWAKALFTQYAWDTSDVVDKEITRYLSVPGQAVTYMLGQLLIMKLKKEAENELKDKFVIKDFHYQVGAVLRPSVLSSRFLTVRRNQALEITVAFCTNSVGWHRPKFLIQCSGSLNEN